MESGRTFASRPRARAALASFGALACLLASCRSRTGGDAPPQPSASASAPAVEDPALSALAGGHLGGLFERTGTSVTVADALVRLPQHTLRLRVVPAQVATHGDVTAASVTVGVELDDALVPGLRAVSVAFDANRREAQERALREWLVGAGVPIVDALRAHGYAPARADAGVDDGAARTSRGDALRLGPFDVFAGPTGARGTPPQGWQSGTVVMHRGLLARFEPAIDELIAPVRRERFHSLALTIHVHNGSAEQGECRVDGVPSPRLCALARGYAWPSGTSDFIFRQYYVLVAPTPGDAGAAVAPSAFAMR